MTNPNDPNNPAESGDSGDGGGPHTSEFEVPAGSFDTPQPGYGADPRFAQQPVYMADPRYMAGFAPQRGNKSTLILGIVIVLLLVAGLIGALFAFRSGAFGGKSGATSVVVTQYTQAPQTVAPKPVAPRQHRNPYPAPAPAPDYSLNYSGRYTNYRVGSSNTSQAFATNVFYAFLSNYSASPGRYHSFDVYSPVTGQYYTMYCRGGDRVVCEGGDNARVVIW